MSGSDQGRQGPRITSPLRSDAHLLVQPLERVQTRPGPLPAFFGIAPQAIATGVAVIAFGRLVYLITVSRPLTAEPWFRAHPWLRLGTILLIAVIALPLRAGPSLQSGVDLISLLVICRGLHILVRRPRAPGHPLATAGPSP